MSAIPQTRQAGRGLAGSRWIEDHEIHRMPGVVVEPGPAPAVDWGEWDRVTCCHRRAPFGAALGIEERGPDHGSVHLRRDHRTAVRRDEGVLNVALRVVEQPAHGPLFHTPSRRWDFVSTTKSTRRPSGNHEA